MFKKIPPPLDLLLNKSGSSPPWPEQITDDRDLAKLVGIRRKLYSDLETIFGRIPEVTTDINEALKSGLIRSDDIVGLYNDLAEFLDVDPDHARLILYLPLELLPDKKSGAGGLKALMAASEKFTVAYLRSWRKLLRESEYRANFVDGDVLEFEIPDKVVLPFVRKAAHLIPAMIQKGLISVAEIIRMLDETGDEVLVYSILDTFPILTDLRFVTAVDWQKLFASKNPALDKAALAQYRNIGPSQQSSRVEIITGFPGNQIASGQLYLVANCLCMDLKRIWYDCERKKIQSAPENRVDWLRQERQGQCYEEYADLLAVAFEQNKITLEDIAGLIKGKDNQIALILGVISARRAAERLIKSEPQRAEAVRDYFNLIFLDLWQGSSRRVLDQLFITWSRWLSVGLIEHSFLEGLGLKMPRLDSFASECRILDDDLNELGPLLERVYSQPDVLKLLYPVCVLFGSRLKGYALHSDSDLDLAVFVRPEVSQDERPRIKRLLEEIYSHEKIRRKVVEFWVENEGGDHLRIKDAPADSRAIADNSWAHLLLCGAWCGEQESIDELYQKLLPNFLFSKGQIIDGKRAKKIWLQMMEMETLQYRLMHKGYLRYHPPEMKAQAERSWPMDPQSSFWDPGYRRIAAKLFVARVFLPELNSSKP